MPCSFSLNLSLLIRDGDNGHDLVTATMAAVHDDEGTVSKDDDNDYEEEEDDDNHDDDEDDSK